MSAVDARILFAASGIHEGMCCDCCGGYCPREEENEDLYWTPVWPFELGGAQYITDRHLLIRTDALTNTDGWEVLDMSAPLPSPELFIVPADRPPVSAALQSIVNLDRIDRAGLALHECTDTLAHLYAGDEHVGWSTVARENGVTHKELLLTRRVASLAGLDLRTAHRARLAVLGGAA